MVRTSTRSSSNKTASSQKEITVKSNKTATKVVSKKSNSTNNKKPEAVVKPKTSQSTAGATALVSIEACKQWGAFKTRANKIVQAVGDKAKVEINAEKPGRGNFVVKVEGVEKPIVELIGMKRPFPPLKALDMDKVCEDVVNALK